MADHQDVPDSDSVSVYKDKSILTLLLSVNFQNYPLKEIIFMFNAL